MESSHDRPNRKLRSRSKSEKALRGYLRWDGGGTRARRREEKRREGERERERERERRERNQRRIWTAQRRVDMFRCICRHALFPFLVRVRVCSSYSRVACTCWCSCVRARARVRAKSHVDEALCEQRGMFFSSGGLNVLLLNHNARGAGFFLPRWNLARGESGGGGGGWE